MNKILLIGNSGTRRHSTDGQTVKVRLYLKKIKDEGFDMEFVELEDFFKKPLSALLRIKKGIKACDRIVLLTAERGCRFLLPFINRINRKYKKPFVLPLIGISVLHNTVDKLNNEQKKDFFQNCLKYKSDKKTSNKLSKITYILPETELLANVFKDFYHLANVHVLTNFRDECSSTSGNNKSNVLKIVFLSRVSRIKGIFDLLDVVDEINKTEQKVQLDIYGKMNFDEEEQKMFNSFINDENMRYLGSIDSLDAISTISQYDLFVFPTRYAGEGTPGVIVESLLSGVPILTSDFFQAKYLLRDGKDSLFFRMFDKDDLKEKLLYIINNKDILCKLKANASDAGKKYTYSHERNNFLKYICGMEEENK